MFAVIKTGGKQYKVTEQQTLRIEKLPDSARREGRVVFSDVLLIADVDGNVTVGKPTIENARVEAQVVRDGEAEKIRVVHYKPKTRHRTVRGHRQPYTEVKIEKIVA